MKQIAGYFVPDGEEHLEEYFASMDSYQPKQRERSLALVPNRRRALDIGAHVGLWTRGLVEQFEQVIAFEPVAEFRQCLRRNVVSPRLTLIPVALGNHSGSVAIEIPSQQSGNAHVVDACQQSRDMPICRLDDFEFGPIDYIKIDVEGYELDVLRGAEQTLRRWQPVVTLEQKTHAERYGHGQYEAVRFLEQVGATMLDRINDDIIMGWPHVPGRVAPAPPRPLKDRLEPAMRRLLRGDFEGAELDYQAILRDDPANPVLYHLLAVARFSLDRREEALATIDRALELLPDYSEALTTKGVFLKICERPQQAIESFEKAVACDPTNAQAHLQLAVLYSQQGDQQAARAAYQKAVRYEPNKAHLDANNLRIDLEQESLVRAPALCRYSTQRAGGAADNH